MSYLVASVLPKSRGNVVDLGICYVGSTVGGEAKEGTVVQGITEVGAVIPPHWLFEPMYGFMLYIPGFFQKVAHGSSNIQDCISL